MATTSHLSRPARGEPDEVRALARTGFAELRRLPGAVWDVHHAISHRSFAASGPAARPIERIHDAISGGVYAGLAKATALVGTGIDVALAARRSGRRRLSDTPGWALLVGIVNGLEGDALRDEGSELAVSMAFRADGQDIELTRAGLAQAFPRATDRLVVYLHGLMETEFSWGAPADTYGARLDRQLGTTSVFLRYNSGLHVSENGAELADLLERLVAAWPVKVRSIALVGHSMGGLVARSASHQASMRKASWDKWVTHIISLGTPHLGAPLEQTVHYASAALNLVPEARPLARFLRRRSAGIRDLRGGSLVDEDWRDRDPDALRAAACREVPLLDGVTHCFVSASLTRSPRHPLGWLMGDMLVLPASASGQGRKRRIAFDPALGLHVGGAGHFALLNHPQVHRQLATWLA